jgi:uncharacterized membrane protein YkvI
MNKNPNYKLTRYLGYIMILIASVMTILVITRFEEINPSIVQILFIPVLYIFGFNSLWKSEENTNKK